MDFINFDGRITGETAELIKVVSGMLGVTPQRLLQQTLSDALSNEQDRNAENEVKVEPWTPNEGCGGFHVVTVVADGYGNLIAEDSQGVELARVEAKEDPKEDTSEDLSALMQKFVGKIQSS